jgi:acetolactate synthase-1/2/3 large subunit
VSSELASPYGEEPGTSRRLGADLVVETLEHLGVGVAFGVPGVHALATWDALQRSTIRYVGARTELSAAFAADGYARASGTPAALLLSTGPGALISLGGLMEAATSYVPVIAIASQISSELLGRGRDALHELADQRASFSPIVKWSATATSTDEIPELVAEAWARALEPPSGPVFLEIPVDLLSAPTDVAPPALPTAPRTGSAEIAGALDEAAELLRLAGSPVVLAGGGVMRSGAWDQLRTLAEHLDAPVLTTFMGKGALSDAHPLAVGSACDEPSYKSALEEADVVLCVASALGEEATSQYTLRFGGRLIHVDVQMGRAASRYDALEVTGDAAAVIAELTSRIPRRTPGDGARRAARTRLRIDAELGTADRLERTLLQAIRRALPERAVHCWDMTILGYWAARDFPAGGPRRFLYPVGSGTLGYAWPAAIGAAIADADTPTFAVVGDGGITYALAELASARQADVNATLLVVDDGGYGILREYQQVAFGATSGVDLVGPDFRALARAFGVASRMATPDTLESDVAWAIAQPGPTVLVLRALLRPPASMQ